MRLPALLLAALPAVSVLAQTQPNLIGTTLNSPLIAQSLHAACTQLPNCVPPGMPAAPPPNPFYWPGGTAWDSQTSTAWVTTGAFLGRYGMNACTVSCAPVPCPRTPGSLATGLEMHDGLNRLYILDSAGGITWTTNTCPPVVINSCATGLGISGFVVTSGLAIDRLRGLIFYSTSDFQFGTGTIYVAPIANPCAWFQMNAVQDCFSNPSLITGMTCDAGRSILYWTNGRGTMELPYTYSGGVVTYGTQTCCIQAAPFPDPYTGLSIRHSAATSTGGPCANGTCPPCPMLHTLRNAPLLGTTLQLGLDQAPVNMPAWCVISFGGCSGGGGGTTSPLCAAPLVNLGAAAITLGMNITSGGVGCTGTTTFPLPLPSNPAFAGLQLSSQCIGLCPPTGTTMSNCLTWVLQ